MDEAVAESVMRRRDTRWRGRDDQAVGAPTSNGVIRERRMRRLSDASLFK